MKLKSLAAFSMSSALTSFSWGVGASGFSNQMVGARAMGQGNAFVAEADDPSAVYFNPAGMVQLDATQLSVGASALVPYAHRDGEGVPEDKMSSQLAVIPNFYLTTKHSGKDADHPWAMGIGLNSPFGLSTDWAPTSSVRYVTTKSSLEMLNINPSVAYQIQPGFAVGAGIDYVNLLNITAKNQVNINGALADGSPDATADLSGHGHGWGYNVGMLFHPVEPHAFGVSYRSQVHMPIKGSMELSNLSTNAQMAGNFNDSTYTTDATSSLVLPASVLTGYAFRPNKRWTFVADYEWTQWSVFDHQDVALQETDPTRLGFINGGNNVITTPRHWRNVSSVGLGANFKQNDTWEWRGGYAFFERTVPTDTFSPDVPDSAVHLFTAGLSRSWGPWVADAAFNAYVYADRHINNTVGNAVGASVNGTYHIFSPALAFNLTYKFH